MVSWCIFSTDTPRFKSSYTANSRSSVAWVAMCHRFSSLSVANLGRFRVSREISAPRTAFIKAISKVSAMDMTSPVAFIWVPSSRLA